MNLLYLSDVFCPWCYGFGPVMRRILADYPGTSVRVLGGDLVDEALTLSEMKEEHPSIREFFRPSGNNYRTIRRRISEDSGGCGERRAGLAHAFPGNRASACRAENSRAGA